MIPKKIHYCWFGGNPLPVLAEQCLASWRKLCPDFEIVRWDESNYDLSAAPLYVRQAYELKKWAFVTDYVRLDLVHAHGGVYMDTDVELIGPLEPLLDNRAYFGFEDGKNINTGLGFGAEAGHPILREMMDDYRDIAFVLPDGSLDQTPCPQRNTEAFLRHGLRQDDSMQLLGGGIRILPSRFLCPVDNRTRKMRKSKDTISVHHYSASWQDEELNRRWRRLQDSHRREDALYDLLHVPNRLASRILGKDAYGRLKTALKGRGTSGSPQKRDGSKL